MARLIFGCGYLGGRVGRRWLDAGEQVYVVTRSPARAARFASEGYRPIVADVLRPETLTELPSADTVLFAVGYGRETRASVHEVFVGGLQAVVHAIHDLPERFIYISSIGVYAQSGGEWVDELSPCEPTREGGRACLAAEQFLATHAMGERAVVLRMAGLYGPGRIPNLEAMRGGLPIAAPEHGYVNLIHVDDAAAVVVAAADRANPPRTYTVSDGHPVLRRAYYDEIARLLGAPSPRFEPPLADSPAASRAGSDKRVANARMMADLGVKLSFPSYREALAAILAAES